MNSTNKASNTKHSSSYKENTGTKSIRPFIREAILVSISPPPDDNSAIELGIQIKNNWFNWRDDYVNYVSEITNESSDSLYFIEGKKFIDANKALAIDRWEGLARIIDFPRLQCVRKNYTVFDTRMCVSICTEGAYSSKLWSRVGICESEKRYGVTVSELSQVVRMYQNIASRTCEWIYKKIEQLLGARIHRINNLEISSFGISDKNLKEYFEKITDDRVSLSELIKNASIKDELALYLDNILGTKNSVEKFIVDKKSEDYVWFTSPVFIDTKNNEVELREVLYLVRSLKDKDQAIGLRYDDSQHGDLARKSALEVARWLGSRI